MQVRCIDLNKGPYFITTAIAYTSGKPHIGNTYEIVLADAIARFKRLNGYDVLFQTGTDEHGLKIQQKAEAAGITPQAFVDDVAGQIREIWDLMHTSYDIFALFRDIAKQGTSVLVATHDYLIINQIPSRVVKIEDGKVFE